jgi:23S rRNA pseudouridine1911/1915/1917 synthase
LSRLSQAFQKREVIKEYLAVVPRKDLPETQRLCHYLIRNTKHNKSYVVDSNHNGAQRAELEYNILVKWDHYMLLHIKLFTGRHHQIRAQLAHMGIPIKGDLKYGAQRSNPDASILLHSYHIKFKHPVKDEWVSYQTLPREKNPLWDLTRLFFLNSKPEGVDKVI